ncbi:hypothetical protein PVAG01_00755 [Phlyctema vagabunda]|uniref:Uncharacterized protein n=1 Tax=Phlyctema vagabunda TaxID=108571 RepID=A0ABR4PV97_9HELO
MPLKRSRAGPRSRGGSQPAAGHDLSDEEMVDAGFGEQVGSARSGTVHPAEEMDSGSDDGDDAGHEAELDAISEGASEGEDASSAPARPSNYAPAGGTLGRNSNALPTRGSAQSRPRPRNATRPTAPAATHGQGGHSATVESDHSAGSDYAGTDIDIDQLPQAAAAEHQRRPASRVTIAEAPATKKKNPTIAPTPFAGSYRSRLTELSLKHAPEILPLLAHVNCSLLSGPTIPTLEELKQHAQAVTILIRELSLSTSGGFIDNANITVKDAEGNRVVVPPFTKGETFDWLNDLQKVYVNTDEHHRLPLVGVANTLDHEELDDFDDADPENPLSAAHWYREWEKCPLTANDVTKSEPGTPSLPFATHQNLIRHANQVLELLDHEYSAKGGLLSILPPAEQKEQRALAETTLLGQMIVWMQSLVLRVHTLERQYANATDILHGESTAPHQLLQKLGVAGRQARLMVYPQDRFVLANCGEDVWNFLNEQLQKKATAEENQRIEERFHGVANQDEDEHYDNLVCVDIYTRYYRLVGQSEKTIFICPAWELHPGVKVTRELEQKPSIVSVVKPVYPDRASEWMMRNNTVLQQAKLDHEEVEQSRERIERLQDEVTVYQELVRLSEAKNHHLLQALESHNNGTKGEDYYVTQHAELELKKRELEKKQEDINREIDELAKRRDQLADSQKSIDDERQNVIERGNQAARVREEELRRLKLEWKQKEEQQTAQYNEHYNEMLRLMNEALEGVKPVIDEIQKMKDQRPWTQQQAREFCDRVYEIAQDTAAGRFIVTPRTAPPRPGEGVILTSPTKSRARARANMAQASSSRYAYADEDEMSVDG